MSRRNKHGMWLAVSAALLGAASMDGFDAVAGGLLVVVLALTYLTGREILGRGAFGSEGEEQSTPASPWSRSRPRLR